MPRLYKLQFIAFALVKFEIHFALFIQCHFILFNDENWLSFYLKDVNYCTGGAAAYDLNSIKYIYFSFHIYMPKRIAAYPLSVPIPHIVLKVRFSLIPRLISIRNKSSKNAFEPA